jgi:hypothetical protein
MLVFKWLHHLSKANWSFANRACLVGLNLFTYRDLTDWLNDPFGVEPIIPSPQQLSFPFAALGQPRPLAKEGTSTVKTGLPAPNPEIYNEAQSNLGQQ